MVSRVEPEEVRKLNLHQGETNFLTEDGLYEVLFQSRKPIAREFKKNVKGYLKELRTKGEVSIVKTPTMSKNRIEAEMFFVQSVGEMLKLSNESKAAMANKVAEKYDLAPRVEYLPLQGIAKSATELLKQFNIPMSAQAFNKAMVAAGLYNVHTHHGHKGDTKFYSLNDNGLAYGKNDVNPEHQDRVQVHFYENSFPTLINSINNI